jgi:hypothetical protein
MDYSKEKYRALKQKYALKGDTAYFLELYGHFLAEREGYKEMDGIDAIYYYLVQKHHWLPRDVRAMSTEDLCFVLAEEMANWKAPKAARESV